MIAFLYPGQGSQHAGMGAAWRQHDSWELVVEASDATGRDVGHLLLEAGDEELRETRNSQLATFVTSMVAFDAVSRLGRRNQRPRRPQPGRVHRAGRLWGAGLLRRSAPGC